MDRQIKIQERLTAVLQNIIAPFGDAYLDFSPANDVSFMGAEDFFLERAYDAVSEPHVTTTALSLTQAAKRRSTFHFTHCMTPHFSKRVDVGKRKRHCV